MPKEQKVGYEQLANVCSDCIKFLRSSTVCYQKCPVDRLQEIIHPEKKKGK